MMAKKPDFPKNVEDLKDYEGNPREISDEAFRGLTKALVKFGDLSGIVWSVRGYLLAGHQRVKALREEFGEALEIKGGALVAPSGELSLKGAG